MRNFEKDKWTNKNGGEREMNEEKMKKIVTTLNKEEIKSIKRKNLF